MRFIFAAALSLSLFAAGAAGAQTPSGAYEGTTNDGRLFRLVVAEDAQQVQLVHLTDQGDTVCGAGHVDRFMGSTVAPIAAGHFEFNMPLSSLGQNSEPTSLATQVTITGDFQQDGSISGTLQAVRTEDPPCDSGELPWSGQYLYDQSSLPIVEGGFTGSATNGGIISFTDDGTFVREFRIGNVDFGPEECSDIASDLPAMIAPGEAEPIANGSFEFYRTFIVAETKPAWTVFVTGTIESDTSASGTVRLIEVDAPGCDTGVLDWTATAPPSPTPEPPAETPVPTAAPSELPASGSEPAGGGSAPGVATLAAIAALIGLGALAFALRRRVR